MSCANKVYKFWLVFFLGQPFYCSYSLASTAAPFAEVVAQQSDVAGFVEVVKAVAEGAPDIAPSESPNLFKKVYGKVKSLFVKTAEEDSLPGPWETATNIIYLVYEAKNTVCSIKSWLLPSNKEALHSLKVSKERDLLKARKAFEDCLVKNPRGKKGSSGRPEVCEEVARMFIMMAGIEEMEKTTNVYNKMRASYSV